MLPTKSKVETVTSFGVTPTDSGAEPTWNSRAIVRPISPTAMPRARTSEVIWSSVKLISQVAVRLSKPAQGELLVSKLKPPGGGAPLATANSSSATRLAASPVSLTMLRNRVRSASL